MLKTVKLLEKKGTIEVILVLSSRKEGAKFGELEKQFKRPSTISKRLKELVNDGFAERMVMHDAYRTVRYRLTERGERLSAILKQLDLA